MELAMRLSTLSRGSVLRQEESMRNMLSTEMAVGTVENLNESGWKEEGRYRG